MSFLQLLLCCFAFGAGVAITWHQRNWICHMAGAVRYWINCPELANHELQQIRDAFKEINDSIAKPPYARTRYSEWYIEYLAWRELGYSANPSSSARSRS